jgi:hypothetical protein
MAKSNLQSVLSQKEITKKSRKCPNLMANLKILANGKLAGDNLEGDQASPNSPRTLLAQDVCLLKVLSCHIALPVSSALAPTATTTRLLQITRKTSGAEMHQPPLN